MSVVTTAGRWFNKAAMPLVRRFSRWPAASGRFGFAVVAYQGRRSRRWFSLVVGFKRTDRGAIIKVELPDQKRWWRNFTDRPRPALLEVAGTQHPGHARTTRDDRGRVHVHLDLD